MGKSAFGQRNGSFLFGNAAISCPAEMCAGVMGSDIHMPACVDCRAHLPLVRSLGNVGNLHCS